MYPCLRSLAGKEGTVITANDTLKEALVQFDVSDSHYGRYWIKFSRLEQVQP